MALAGNKTTESMIGDLPATPEDEAPAGAPGWCHNAIAAWLIDHRGRAMSLLELMSELCESLVAEGVPLLRVSASMPAMHPQAVVRGVFWIRGQGAGEQAREHGIFETSAYKDSPVALIHQGAGAIRRRLEQDTAVLDFPILRELKAQGATDYVVLPMRFTRGRPSFMSWTTDRPGGFTTAELTLLSDLMPLIALRFEIHAAYRMTSDLLTTYLGRGATERVLSGTVRRGQGTPIRAAIWYCDLRGFTAMADQMKTHDLITTLDDYFECMARPVQDHGGEVLKFVGDALLAIFRVDGEATHAGQAALDAAISAFEGLHLLNQGRALEGGAPLRVGIALHLGEVIYGNIGASDRLDFTVIGPAVNEVVRIEASCAKLGHPLLASAAFAAECCGPGCLHAMVSVGRHVLRGVREPQELFALPDSALP